MQGRGEIDLKQIEAIMEGASIPGVSIATVNGNEKPSTIVLGKDTNSETSVTPETVFGAASLSKPLFAYLVLKLMEANKSNEDKSEWLGKFNQHLDLDTLLKDILPYAELSAKVNEKLGGADKDRGNLLTAKMILSHQTGLHIGKLEFDFEPGSGNCGYSGVPFGYLQKVIEKLTGSTLETLAQEFVFKPLGMNHSSFARGYDLCLISSLPESGQPERNKLYIEYNKENNELRYTVLNPEDIGISGLIEKSDLEKLGEKTGVEKYNLFLQALKASDLIKLQPFLTDILDITSEKKHTRARHAANSLHTTASDYALFCAAWTNDENEEMQNAFVPAVFMMKDKIINDKGEPSCQQVSQDDLKKVAYGLGWELQIDDKGVMAYHAGDMDEWRATVAINLKDKKNKTTTVYFSNSQNGHILQDQIISPNGELENGLNFFRKYGFARTLEELKPDWREKPSWGLRDIFYLSVENITDTNKKKINFFYDGLVESNKENLMLVIFQSDDEDHPFEIPMRYDHAANQYTVAIETGDFCEMFLITKAKAVGDIENPKAEVLQKGFVSLKDGILQPVNKMPGAPSGELKTFLLKNNGDLIKSDTNVTSLQERDRFVTVYLPPGYNPNKMPPYKLQITLDGGQYLNPMQMNVVMDNLTAAKEIEPVVTVFISPHSGPPKEGANGFGLVMPNGYSLAMRLKEYSCNSEFSDKLAALPTTMSQQFNISLDRENITIWGVSAGGLQAIYTGLLHPNVFGNVVAESPQSWNIPEQNGEDWREEIKDEWIEIKDEGKKKTVDITWSTATALLTEKEGEHKEHITQMVQMGHDSISGRKLDKSNPVRFYLDAGSRESEYDSRPEVGSVNLLKGAEVFADAAMKEGHTVVDNNVHVIPNGGHHNMTWMRNQADIMRSMHCSPILSLEKEYSESLAGTKSKILIKPPSISSQSIFSQHETSSKGDKQGDTKILGFRKKGH